MAGAELSRVVDVTLAVADRPEAAGGRLDAFLVRRLHRYTRCEVQKLIRRGRVFFRGKPAKASAKVRLSDVIIVRYPRRPEESCRHARLPVLFEDRRILAVNKPGDVLSHPTDKSRLNAVTTILAGQFPGLRLRLVHRLDRETSGILLLAKDAGTARELQEEFAAGRVRKEYRAIVRGRVSFRRRLVDAPLGRKDGEIKVRQTVREGGAPSKTEFRRVSAGARASLLRALPRTGRLHQIRVHLASIGHPVLGDKLYQHGGRYYLKAVMRKLAPEDLTALGASRQMLHAHRLTLGRPGGSPLELEAPVPPDFEAAAEEYGLSGGPGLRY